MGTHACCLSCWCICALALLLFSFSLALLPLTLTIIRALACNVAIVLLHLILLTQFDHAAIYFSLPTAILPLHNFPPCRSTCVNWPTHPLSPAQSPGEPASPPHLAARAHFTATTTCLALLLLCFCTHHLRRRTPVTCLQGPSAAPLQRNHEASACPLSVICTRSCITPAAPARNNHASRARRSAVLSDPHSRASNILQERNIACCSSRILRSPHGCPAHQVCVLYAHACTCVSRHHACAATSDFSHACFAALTFQ